MTLEEMKTIRRERGISLQLLSDRSGVPVPTLQKIFSGETARPRYVTLAAIEGALQQMAGKDFYPAETSASFGGGTAAPDTLSGSAAAPPGRTAYPAAESSGAGERGAYGAVYGNLPKDSTPVMVREDSSFYGAGNTARKRTSERNDVGAGIFPPGNDAESEEARKNRELIARIFATKKQGEFTTEDYRYLPEDARVELLDGRFIFMDAPTKLHAKIAGEIHRQIANYIVDRDGPCEVYIAPVDVQLDCDNKTMVQPDISIVCEDKYPGRRNIFGAPDFVLEIISPSTGRLDYGEKLAKYMRAGVREYWIVDPEKHRVLVYFFGSKEFLSIYPIDGDIPVGIYDGDLVISFKRIDRWVKEAETSEA